MKIKWSLYNLSILPEGSNLSKSNKEDTAVFANNMAKVLQPYSTKWIDFDNDVNLFRATIYY